jgi:preprotein translocase subunit SecE
LALSEKEMSRVSKRDDQITGEREDSAELSLPEPPPAAPARVSSSDVPPGVPPPRAARFGEGAEGSGARRERGVTGSRANFFERIGLFLHDVRLEMKRVSWPTANDVKNTTIITIIAVIFFSIYLFGVDHALAFGIEQLEHFVDWLVRVL